MRITIMRVPFSVSDSFYALWFGSSFVESDGTFEWWCGVADLFQLLFGGVFGDDNVLVPFETVTAAARHERLLCEVCCSWFAGFRYEFDVSAHASTIFRFRFLLC